MRHPRDILPGMANFNGPFDQESDELISGAFDLKDAGIDQLIAEGHADPRGERAYWYEVLVSHPEGPQMADAEFEIVFAGMVG